MIATKAEHMRVALLILVARGQVNGDPDAFDLAEQKRLAHALPPFTCDEQQAAAAVVSAMRRGEVPGLGEVLRLCGLRTVSAGQLPAITFRDVVDLENNVLLASSTCNGVWSWLRETGRWPLAGGQ